MKLDPKDRRLLAELQTDSARPVAELAEEIGLSPTPCWRRIQRLEEEGFLRARVALCDRDKLNLPVTVFVTVKAERHAQDWLDRFKKAVQDIPEIIEAHRMSGEIDYLLKVAVPSIAAYDQVYRMLINKVAFSDVTSSFAMEELKYTTALPTHYAP